MTKAQVAAEVAYREQECLGMMCEDRTPTVAERMLAHTAGQEWLMRFMELPTGERDGMG